MVHIAIAAAITIDRIVAWLDERPRAKTRTSRVAALAPACAIPSRLLHGKDYHCPPGLGDLRVEKALYLFLRPK